MNNCHPFCMLEIWAINVEAILHPSYNAQGNGCNKIIILHEWSIMTAIMCYSKFCTLDHLNRCIIIVLLVFCITEFCFLTFCKSVDWLSNVAQMYIMYLFCWNTCTKCTVSKLCMLPCRKSEHRTKCSFVWYCNKLLVLFYSSFCHSCTFAYHTFQMSNVR